MDPRRLVLALPLLMALALLPLVAGPAVAAAPVTTTTTITSIDPPSPGYVGQPVTMKVKVTAADGSVPQGTVYWDDAGACGTDVTSAPVGADGTVTLTYAFPYAYPTFSMNACFTPTDSAAYASSEDFGPFYDARTVPTTTTITSIDPPSPGYVGQPVTMKVKVTAADGSVPQGTVSWDDGGACGTDVAHAPVGPDGTVTLTHTFDTPYPTYSMNACFTATDSNVYQDSEDFGPFYDARTIPTTTTITSIDPPHGSPVGTTVTMKVKVTAADGSVPQGTVSWDDAGACGTDVAHGPVGPDGTVTLTHTFDTAYPTYSMNACFVPDAGGAYQPSEDFGPFYDAGPLATTTTITSITPSGGATVGQTVTMKVKVTAVDGSVPVGTVYWDDAGACGTDVTSAPVGADGTVTLTYAFPSAYPTYSMNACFSPTDLDVYQSSEDFGPFYAVQDAPPPAPPVVTQQPRSTTAVVGDEVTFSADASGTPSPGVQWQRSTDGGHSWTSLSGATSRSLHVTARATLNGARYRAVFANPSGSTHTSPAVLLVTEGFLGYTTPSAGAKVKRGTTVSTTFRLGDDNGHLLADAVAAKVPTVVQLWSGKPAVAASASCTYATSKHQFRCALKVPSATAAGTYHLAALTRLGSGPWVPAEASSTAHNPQTVTITH